MNSAIGGLLAAALLAGAMAPASAAPVKRAATAPATGADPVKAGVDAWETGNYARALSVWRPLAASGNADAQYNLAQAYRLGRGVTVDEKTAQDWYRKAAVQNHPQAQANYGLLLFQNGDRTGALPWLRKAADRGDPRAQYVVGTALFNGDIAPKDWVRAYALMTRAAAAGLPPAATSLAEMDKYVPLQQRQQGTALARELQRSAALTKPEEPALQVAQAAPVKAKTDPAPVKKAEPAPRTIPVTPATPVKTASVAPVVAKPLPPVKTAAAKPTPAAPLKDGDWRVQVGAYGDPAAAGKVWEGIARKTPGLALRSYLVKAGAVTRLQAGPLATRADANKACARIKASSGSDCFPVAAK